MPIYTVKKSYERTDGIFYVAGDVVELTSADIANMPAELKSEFGQVFQPETEHGEKMAERILKQ